MIAKDLYAQLEKDFITKEMTDDWAPHMQAVSDFLCPNFIQRSMGLVCDNSDEITHVYSAVFPSNKVMQQIIDNDAKDVLLFVHHPSNWGVTQSPPFFQMDKELLQQFKEQKISIYNLHVPLDAFGPYSTSVTFAKALNIDVQEAFSPYRGGLAGVIGTTNLKTITELHKVFTQVFGHEISLYAYGDDEIVDGRVALLAGGGNEVDIIKEIKEKGINTVLTGVSVKNDFTKEVHDFEKENRINLLGGTHYSTEKFACIEICKYFEKMGLSSEFIADVPALEDL